MVIYIVLGGVNMHLRVRISTAIVGIISVSLALVPIASAAESFSGSQVRPISSDVQQSVEETTASSIDQERTPPAGLYKIGDKIFYYDPEKNTLEPAQALESATLDDSEASVPANTDLDTAPDSTSATEAKNGYSILDFVLMGSLAICFFFLIVVMFKISEAGDIESAQRREDWQKAYDTGFEAGTRHSHRY